MGTRTRQRRRDTIERESTLESQPGSVDQVAPPVSTINRRSTSLIIIALVLITAIVFHSTPQNHFINYDDQVHVFQNPYLNPVTAQHVAFFWWHPIGHSMQYASTIEGANGVRSINIPPYQQLYAPVFFTVYAVLADFARLPQTRNEPGVGDYSLDPMVFHSANVILHIINVLIVFGILRLLISNLPPLSKGRVGAGPDLAAAAGALIFAVHPVQVEPVSWVTGMNNVLSGTCGLAALLLYLKGAAGRSGSVAAEWGRGIGIAAILLYTLALLTKPISLVLLPIAWLLDVLITADPARPVNRRMADAAIALAPWIVLAGVAAAVNGLSQPDVTTDAQVSVPGWFRVMLMLDSYAFYLGKLLWPAALSVDYARTPHYLFVHGYPYATCWATIGTAMVLFLLRKRLPILAISGLLFFVALLPMSGLVPYYFHATSIVADRYLYLAMLAPALAVAGLLAARPNIAGSVVAAAVIAALGVCSNVQTAYWRDSSTLYRHALQVYPNSYKASFNYATILADEGNWGSAVPLFVKAATINPTGEATYNAALALTENGILQLQSGDVGSAQDTFQQAIRWDPDFDRAHGLLGNTFLQQHDFADAEAQMREVVRIAPGAANAHHGLGVALAMEGKTQEAIGEFRSAVQFDPTNPRYQQDLNHALSTSSSTPTSALHTGSVTIH